MGYRKLLKEVSEAQARLHAAAETARQLGPENYYTGQIYALVSQAGNSLEQAVYFAAKNVKRAEDEIKKTAIRLGILVLLCFAALSVFAQAPAKVDVKPDPAQLTQIELLELKNIQLDFSGTQAQIQLSQVKLQNLQSAFQQLAAQIEKDHPGYRLNDQGQLVAKADEKKAEPEKARK